MAVMFGESDVCDTETFSEKGEQVAESSGWDGREEDIVCNISSIFCNAVHKRRNMST